MKKRKDGLYASQIYLGSEPVLDTDGTPVLDKNGKPKQKRNYKTVYGKTQKEVKAEIAELKLKLGKGIDISAADDRFKVWIDRFLENKKSEGISTAYYKSLELCCSHLSSLYWIPISEISPNDIQQILTRLSLYHDGKRPLSKRTLTLIKQTATQVFKLAASLRIIEYIPSEYVKIPQNTAIGKREALTEEQQEWVVNTPHKAQRAAMLMMYSGLRRGEATALTWADVNLQDGHIEVTKAAEFINGQPRIKKPKTDAGYRTVDIPEPLINFLAEEKKKDDFLYFLHNDKGEMLSESAWRRMWESYMCDLNVKYGYNEQVHKNNPVKLQMKIERFTPHQLRHTFATLLYYAGVNEREAKDLLGHSDITTTLNIYTHLDKKKRSGAKKLTEYLCQYDASNNN